MPTGPNDYQYRLIAFLSKLGMYGEVAKYLQQGAFVNSAASILKQLYSDMSNNIMKNLVYGDNPFLSMVEKSDFKGQSYPVPVEYGKKRKKL